VEVALAVQFSEPKVETFDVAALGRRLRTELPRRLEQPARPPVEERFEGGPGPTVRFEVFTAPQMPRYWFLSDDETRLVQVQHDLIAHNWRKMGSGAEYPRFTVLREGLSRYLHDLSEVLAAEEKGELKPNWCEVTYINHIPASIDSDRLALHDVVNMVSLMNSPTFLPEPEDAQFAARFRMEENGSAVGRLTLAAAPAVSATDGKEIWTLTLTARALATEATVASAFGRLNLCHEWVVRGFRDITTDRMHDFWGLREKAA
jgi:uncharacterized protein (TIGR04255 family)